MAISLTPELRAEYQRLFDTCVIAPDKYPFVDAAVNTILKSKSRYDAVSAITGVPWFFIAIPHYMEGAGRFDRHLHNGDPLTARTTHVPKGRPAGGTPPFTWEESAVDALTFTGITKWTDWSLPGILFKLEGYNGYGYRTKAKPPINTPYLWSFTNHYTKGKFVEDGKYSPTAVSKQVGAACILRRLAEKQITAFVESHMSRIDLIKELGTVVLYAPTRYNAKAEQLQLLLNLNGAHLKADGKAGRITSDAYKAVTGKFLNGDPRG